MRHPVPTSVSSVLLLSGLLLASAPLAAAPANDNRANATVIATLPFTDAINTTDATREGRDPFCHGISPSPTVWYAFTPSVTTRVQADTFESDYDTSLSVYTEVDELGNLDFIDCTTDVGGTLQSQVRFKASAGVTYFIMVDSSTGFGGNLRFRVTLDFPPPEIADRVIGQRNFINASCNTFGRNASSLCNPRGEVLDDAGNLYVADTSNHRVLIFMSPLNTDIVADLVIGQPDFFTGNPNTGGVSASSLSAPTEVALDAAGNLYVADRGNNRVLEYDSPLTTDLLADRVFGQPDFSTQTQNTGGLSASSLAVPSGVALDSLGNLYVGEFSNNRVVVYLSPLATDAVADLVFGQPDFTTNTCNTGGLGAGSLCIATGVAIDPAGNLYVSDTGNDRVLLYEGPLTTDRVAERVFGKLDFTTPRDLITLPDGSTACNTPTAASLCDPRGVEVDAAGSLYVADSGFSFSNPSSRVVVYENPLTTDTMADRVFGQPNLFTGGCNSAELFSSGHAYTLCLPLGVAVDATGDLYAGDMRNSRVLVFDDADDDGIPDSHDACPNDPVNDIDADGICGDVDACPNENPGGLDADQDGCIDTLGGLRSIVQGLAIDPMVKNGLLAKLNEAQKALNRNNTQVAVNKLRDFITQVESQRGKNISSSDADLLVSYANNVISTLM